MTARRRDGDSGTRSGDLPAPRRGRTAVSAGSREIPRPPHPRTPDGRASDDGLGRSLSDLPPDLGALLSPAAVRGAVMEALWTAAHLMIYPFGVLTDRADTRERYHLGDLAPHQRGLVVGDVEAAGTPILLVHGMIDNRMIFTVLRRRLRRRGFGRVFTINYSPVTNDIRAAARDLSGAIEEMVARTGYERIHVIGHSLGGLIARYYVQRLGGDERVHTLVTLGTPHAGSLLAYAMPPVNLGRQLRPGSELYAELAEPAPGCRTRVVAYYSDLDQVVIPHTHGRLDHPDLTVRNVRVHAVGHMSLPIEGSVVREIGAMLSQLDTHGDTVTAGITSLASGGWR
ncbi:MAG: alpha/beta fold hydrolase [Kineosporiaceae bacterium]|nr:alpha/beta fold hydrolase [Kineosporiaceae bacterium]